MFAVVAAMALAIVSFRSGSTFWQVVLGLAAMLAIGLATIAVILDRGPRRAFAIGAAVMMYGYALFLATCSLFPDEFGNDATSPIAEVLLAVRNKLDHSGYVYSNGDRI